MYFIKSFRQKVQLTFKDDFNKLLLFIDDIIFVSKIETFHLEYDSNIF